jgi:hypothetical protein
MPEPGVSSPGVVNAPLDADMALVLMSTLLLPVCQSEQSQRIEIWPALLCKALCKLAGGCEETLVGGGGPAVVSWLCGVIPHTVTPHITRLPPDLVAAMSKIAPEDFDPAGDGIMIPGLPPMPIKLPPKHFDISERSAELRGQICNIVDVEGFEFTSHGVDKEWWLFLRVLL